ncbi:MAG: tRNA (adenosine(37)-N6)-threonylcarbamoyltransferase complex ATPase subunit type 1 TsaE [Patescibacteria group bacterium]|nr:tRNA (adenosine(37)-N6)-threonylcarbamoyltransferase complex ATPase subunit type 1 TsaE [Patescibacteria group bacterium]MBU1953174.1 tRNA (adenosine(37)-N6)-threonylcarbamoyltransferase complex ATPase subunit type 1 TsaE [Patescibacteria group bacterium]
MEIITHSTEETKKLASEIAEKTKLGDTLALYGDLGSGKTTFTRYLVESLGLKNRVQSPTFVIARKYGHVNHIDLYRIISEKEVGDLGIKEMIEDENSIMIIEWPELAENLLPENTIRIYFEYVDENSRKIRI